MGQETKLEIGQEILLVQDTMTQEVEENLSAS